MAPLRRAAALVCCLLAASCSVQGAALGSPESNATASAPPLPSATSFKGHTSGATYLPLLVLLVVPGVAVLQLRVDHARVLLSRRRETLQLRKAALRGVASGGDAGGGDAVAVAVTEQA